MYAQSHAVHWTQNASKNKAYTKELTHALLYVENYKTIATPMNSNKFTEIDKKKAKTLT